MAKSRTPNTSDEKTAPAAEKPKRMKLRPADLKSPDAVGMVRPSANNMTNHEKRIRRLENLVAELTDTAG